MAILCSKQREGGADNKVAVYIQTVTALFPPKADGLCLGCNERLPPEQPDMGCLVSSFCPGISLRNRQQTCLAAYLEQEQSFTVTQVK